MKPPEGKIEQLRNGLVKYCEGEKSQFAIYEDTLTKAELRLLCYFIVNSKHMFISTKRRETFRKIVLEGDIPEQFGYITKSDKVFCVQKTGEEYKLYMGVDSATPFHVILRSFVENVKK